ncbi:MAG: M81 family metallopeptidase [Clostridia bacterium]|nr:M81 family metallopeptidase [Clostridia bacterium]
MRIFVLEFHQESNTFNPVVASEKYFSPAVKDDPANTQEQIRIRGCFSGAVTLLQEAGCEIIPSVVATAPSGGRVSDAFYFSLCDKIKEKLQAAGEIDGVYVALHGATCTETVDDACGTLIEMIRGLVGDKPIAASFDLHANITERMLQNIDYICGYQTYPHVDHYTTGQRAARFLLNHLAGERPYKATATVDVLVPPAGYTSLEGAFKDLIDQGKAMVECGDITDFTLFPVQPWLDIAELTSRAVTYGPDPEKAKTCADRLIAGLLALKDQMQPNLYSVEEIIRIAEENTTGKPVLLADSADSPNGGAVGDSPVVAMKLQELGSKISACMVIVDPDAVEYAYKVGVGNTAEFTVGAGFTKGMPGPLKATGTVRSLHNGDYRTWKHGDSSLGKSAVVCFGNMDILLCNMVTNSGSPALFRGFGMEPTHYDLVVIKANTSFRAPYAPISDLIYVADTPGAGASNLLQFRWENVPQSFYPFAEPKPTPAKLW